MIRHLPLSDTVQPSEQDIIDQLSAHLEAAGAPDRAAMHIGVFLAWCVNHELISEQVRRRHGGLLIKVKLRELDGSDLLLRIAGGQLSEDLLSEAGRKFARAYYGDYLGDYAAALGLDPERPYDVEDSWGVYDQIAPLLTRKQRDRQRSPAKAAVVSLFSKGRRTKGKRHWLRLVR